MPSLPSLHLHPSKVYSRLVTTPQTHSPLVTSTAPSSTHGLRVSPHGLACEPPHTSPSYHTSPSVSHVPLQQAQLTPPVTPPHLAHPSTAGTARVQSLPTRQRPIEHTIQIKEPGLPAQPSTLVEGKGKAVLEEQEDSSDDDAPSVLVRENTLASVQGTPSCI
uniref:Uncharacterized protein n=1 Tax=Cannabis sativa TaxID=3483 RepID=A0A803PHJ0_CANSA